MVQEYYEELIETVKNKKLSKSDIARLKVELCRKYKVKKVPTDIEVLMRADVYDVGRLDALQTKPVRTISGVTPIAIMTKPWNCPHGRCTFCPGGLNSSFGDVPQSYTGHEPATMRGIRNHYDGYLQVFNRLEQFTVLGHNTDKVELIVMGGTFPAMPKEYQAEFIGYAFKAMNDFSDMFFSNQKLKISGVNKGGFINDGKLDLVKFKEFFEMPGSVGSKDRVDRIHERLLKAKGSLDLEHEQLRNETSKVRCVALCIETKPDWGKLEHGNMMLRLGCTRVELGVQTVYDDVLAKTHRGHTVADTIESIRILKDLGFKITAHHMPGMPLTDRQRDIEGFKELFSNPDFRPDMLKIYPCMVSPGTGLYHEYKQGNFKPITTEEAAELIAEFKKYIPEYCRVQRVQRDVPTKFWEAGVGITNLRQYIFDKYKPNCRCIRCREPKDKKIDFGNVKIKVNEYKASKGTEFFISAEDAKNDVLLGFCRLRFPSQALRPEITEKSALIRELHVYGQAVGIDQHENKLIQHRGLGKQLMEKAEEIAKANEKDKMVVISGVGAREYYRKLGYKKEGVYMDKNFC